MIRELSDERKEQLIEILTGELAVLRAKMGLSQKDMASRLGVARQTYGTIENRIQKMTWSNFLALLFIFTNHTETAKMIDEIGVYPPDLEGYIKDFNASNEETENRDRLTPQIPSAKIRQIRGVVILVYDFLTDKAPELQWIDVSRELQKVIDGLAAMLEPITLDRDSKEKRLDKLYDALEEAFENKGKKSDAYITILNAVKNKELEFLLVDDEWRTSGGDILEILTQIKRRLIHLSPRQGILERRKHKAVIKKLLTNIEETIGENVIVKIGELNWDCKREWWDDGKTDDGFAASLDGETFSIRNDYYETAYAKTALQLEPCTEYLFSIDVRTTGYVRNPKEAAEQPSLNGGAGLYYQTAKDGDIVLYSIGFHHQSEWKTVSWKVQTNDTTSYTVTMRNGASKISCKGTAHFRNLKWDKIGTIERQ